MVLAYQSLEVCKYLDYYLTMVFGLSTRNLALAVVAAAEAGYL